MKTRYVFLLLMFLGIPLTAGAQSTFGSIVGVAQDTNLATVPGATITIKNLDENATRSTTSDSQGGFQFLNLKPGRYEIAATKSGFTDFKLAEVSLEARQTLRVEVKFQVAAIGASVDITADSVAMINTESGTIGDTKNFQQVTQLPVNYRGATTSPLAAIATVPSVQQDNDGRVSIVSC